VTGVPAATRSFIVGTAGHIDHGKSALIQALTGTDPDRLKEERERGITIDLGFAHLESGELTYSFVDVPGHERFVRNMLAGAHGIDAVLLVVAADESVMPQTREHFHICRLLGIPRGVIVVTKMDVADPELAELAEMEVRDLVSGSFLEAAEVVRVSAKTGDGLDDLRGALGRVFEGVERRSALGLARLPIDRVFTLRGFGTVVTGTLVGGSLATGDAVEVLPRGLVSRIRGLQVHGSLEQIVSAGSRTAVNLTALETGELSRGDVVARPGTLLPTSMLDVELSLLPDSRPLRNGARVRVHVASGEHLARVRLLEADRLAPGDTGLAQLRLETPTVAGRLDALILRAYSPAITIGGARVLDPLPPKRTRPERVRKLVGARSNDVVVRWVEEAAERGIAEPVLSARATLPVDRLRDSLAGHERLAVLGDSPRHYVPESAVQARSERALAALRALHAAQPLKAGLPREALRDKGYRDAAPGLFDAVLDRLVQAGAIRAEGDSVALAGHRVELSGQEMRGHEALLVAARTAGLEGLSEDEAIGAIGRDPKLARRVVSLTLDSARIVRVADRLVDRQAVDDLTTKLHESWPPGSRVDVKAFKELTGLTRKHLIPLLEHLDQTRVTQRSGNERVVLKPPSSA